MTTTTSTLSAPIQQSFSMKLLSVPVPNFIYNTAAMYKRMPSNGGTTLRMRRYNRLETAVVPLENTGITPPPQQLSAVDIDAKVDFYGTWLKLNEQVTLQAQDAPLNEAALRLGVSLRESEDALTREMLRSSASSINCTGGVNGDNPTELTRSDVDTVVRTLADNDGWTIMDNIEGEDRFGTGPTRDAYLAMASTKLIGDLEQVDGFIAKSQYPSPMEAIRPEWCSISNLRFLLSSVGAFTENSSNNDNDVYHITCAAMEAYAVIEQDNYSAQFIYRPPIYESPLALNASVGYKYAQVPRITNDAWIINLNCTRSDA